MKIGMTGGIACGKNYIASLFEKKGCHIIDADEVSRIVMGPGGAAHKMVLDAFGTADRAELRNIVINDPQKRKELEAIVHPAVAVYTRVRTGEILGKNEDAVVIHHAPLLIEAGGLDKYDAVILIWCSRESQLARLKQRGFPPYAEALKLMDAQMPYDDKLKYADFIIDNDSTPENAQNEVERVYNLLKTFRYTKKINRRTER